MSLLIKHTFMNGFPIPDNFTEFSSVCEGVSTPFPESMLEGLGEDVRTVPVVIAPKMVSQRTFSISGAGCSI